MHNFINRLEILRDQGQILDIDLEWCRFLSKQHPAASSQVILAACLTSYVYRQGDVCLILNNYAGQRVFNDFEEEDGYVVASLKELRKELKESPLVGAPGDFKPLILDSEDRLYMHKLWHYEKTLADKLINRSQEQVDQLDKELLNDGLRRLFDSPDEQTDWQQIAAAGALRNKLSIISGGPGTGKTSTVVRILALLLEQAKEQKEQPHIVLTAPTGKAAARLQESIRSARDNINVSDDIRSAIPDSAVTLHQLLGARRHTSAFKHDEDNPLPYDVIIVDEVSMVDQALMSKLMKALLEDTKLILLGDKDQLASVEAGSVLGDICLHAENSYSSNMADWLQSLSLTLPHSSIASNPKPLTDNITLLTKSYRFDHGSGISLLAESINNGEAEEAIRLLTSSKHSSIAFTQLEDAADLEKIIARKVDRYYSKLVKNISPKKAFSILREFRILAAHRSGPWGIEYLNKLVEEMLSRKKLVPKYRQWYAGKPVIVNVNDYSLGLYNGDTGICLPNDEGELRVYFEGEEGFKEIIPNRLPNHNRAYALTVHKSQGAEFNHILLMLPVQTSKVVSRELIYTAVTRARTTVDVLSTKKTFRKGIASKLKRRSGLSNRLLSV